MARDFSKLPADPALRSALGLDPASQVTALARMYGEDPGHHGRPTTPSTCTTCSRLNRVWRAMSTTDQRIVRELVRQTMRDQGVE